MKLNKLKNIILSSVVTLSILMQTANVYAIRDSVTTKRLGGNDRFETAIEISKEFVGNTKKTVDSVILCTAYDYADSISVTPFAVYANAPILLTAADKLDLKTKARIQDMKIKKVYVVGGLGAISDDVYYELKYMGLEVERIGGKTRFETNRLIMDKIPKVFWGTNVKVIDGNDPYLGFSLAVDTIDSSSNGNNLIINPIILIKENSEEESTDLFKYLSSKLDVSVRVNIFFDTFKYTWFQQSLNSDSNKYKVNNLYSVTKEDMTASRYYTLLNNINFSANYQRSKYSKGSLIITTPESYADAMSIGPLAGLTFTPIVYIAPTEKTVSQWLGSDGVTNMQSLINPYKDTQGVYYIGGKSIVSDGCEGLLRGKDIED